MKNEFSKIRPKHWPWRQNQGLAFSKKLKKQKQKRKKKTNFLQTSILEAF